MKRILPYIMGLLLLLAAAAGVLLIKYADKRKDTSFEGASFVLSETGVREDTSVTAVKFVSGGDPV